MSFTPQIEKKYRSYEIQLLQTIIYNLFSILKSSNKKTHRHYHLFQFLFWLVKIQLLWFHALKAFWGLN